MNGITVAADRSGNDKGHGIRGEMEAFRKACASENAWAWLISHGYSEGAAKEKLMFWAWKYPGIALEYGGKKRLLRRPHRGAVAAAAEAGTEGTAEAEAEIAKASVDKKLPGENGAGPGTVTEAAEAEGAGTMAEQETDENAGPWDEERRSRLGEMNRSGGRQRCLEALEAGQPFLYLTSQRGMSVRNAQRTIRRWQKLYPDLFEAVEDQDSLPEVSEVRENPEGADQEMDAAPLPARTAEEPEKVPKSKTEDDASLPDSPEDGEDMISLEEFLAEFGAKEDKEMNVEMIPEKKAGADLRRDGEKKKPQDAADCFGDEEMAERMNAGNSADETERTETERRTGADDTAEADPDREILSGQQPRRNDSGFAGYGYPRKGVMFGNRSGMGDTVFRRFDDPDQGNFYEQLARMNDPSLAGYPAYGNASTSAGYTWNGRPRHDRAAEAQKDRSMRRVLSMLMHHEAELIEYISRLQDQVMDMREVRMRIEEMLNG